MRLLEELITKPDLNNTKECNIELADRLRE